jgi:hypothetical protein
MIILYDPWGSTGVDDLVELNRRKPIEDGKAYIMGGNLKFKWGL